MRGSLEITDSATASPPIAKESNSIGLLLWYKENVLISSVWQELAEKKEELKRMEEGLANSAPSTADTRPLEDLLSFIQEDKSKEGKGRGKKKKSKKKRDSISSKEEPAHTRTSSEDQIGQAPLHPTHILRSRYLCSEASLPGV